MAQTYRNIVEVPESGYHYFRHYFIPHDGNNHQPLVLRPTALKVYSALLIGIKLFLTGFLYIAYPTPGHFAELTASKIFSLTNEARVSNGVAALRLNGTLSQAASAKANDMLAKGYFDHTGPDGKKFWQWIKESGYRYTVAGENLAMDFTTAESAHNALMASTSHRNNILKSGYSEIGIAVAQGTMNGRETTVLVQMFGTPPSSAPSTPPAAQPASSGSSASQGSAAQQAAPQPVVYSAELVGTSDEAFVLLPGSTIDVWADFKNTGNTSWLQSGEHFVALNLTNPAGRISSFAADNWPALYRPTLLDQERVRPGEVSRIVFTLHAPGIPGTYQESFALVVENRQWIQGGSVTLPITVVQPTVAAAEDTAPQDEVQAAFNTTAIEVIPSDGAESIIPTESTAPLVVQNTSQLPDWQRMVIDWSIRFFWALLMFLTVALVLNIAIRARVQHRHVIAQTLVVIGLTTFMALVKFHFAEQISTVFVH